MQSQLQLVSVKLQSRIGMKKIPLKITRNNQRLKLNRVIPNENQDPMPKSTLLKEKLNNFPKLQQKEESSMNRHRLPTLHSISATKRTTLKSQSRVSLASSQKLPASPPKTQIRIGRSSSTREAKNGQEMVRLPTAVVRQGLAGFVLLLEQKKILQRRQKIINVSSESFRNILLYIITSFKQTEKNQAVFLESIRKEEVLDGFMRTQDEKQLLGVPHGHFLRLCSATISVTESDSGVNGQMVKELARVAGVLVKEVAELQASKEGLKVEIDSQLRTIKENSRKILSFQFQLESTRHEMQSLKEGLVKEKQHLLLTQVRKEEIRNFVYTQPNLIAKDAAEYHKNLEIDMFQYADFLRHHPLGRKDFEPSIFYNEIQRMLNAEIKQGIASLLSPKPMQEKQEKLKQFVKHLRHQYKLMIDELTRTITEKTKYIHKFTEVVHRWYENYLAKKEYLSGLTEAFSLEAVTMQHLRQGIETYCGQEKLNGKATSSSPACLAAMWKIFGGIDKLVELFSLGNSFY